MSATLKQNHYEKLRATQDRRVLDALRYTLEKDEKDAATASSVWASHRFIFKGECYSRDTVYRIIRRLLARGEVRDSGRDLLGERLFTLASR